MKLCLYYVSRLKLLYPSQYYNKVLAVPAEVENIVGSNAFTLDEDELIGASDLLVLVPAPKNKPASASDDNQQRC